MMMLSVGVIIIVIWLIGWGCIVLLVVNVFCILDVEMIVKVVVWVVELGGGWGVIVCGLGCFYGDNV